MYVRANLQGGYILDPCLNLTTVSCGGERTTKGQ
jgi:hypothetical protein